MVQAPVQARVVGAVDQLMRGDRQAHPGTGFAAVVIDDLLIQAEAKLLLGKSPVGSDVSGQDIHVVEPLDGGTAPDVALRDVLERRPELGWGLISLALVGQLQQMTVWGSEAVGGPMTMIAVDPAEAQTALLDCRHPSLQRLRAPRPDRQVSEAGQVRLGQLQAVTLIVAPATQVHGG